VDIGVDDLCKVGMVSRVGLQRVQGGEVLLRWSGTKWLQSGNVENR
jgi:ribosomal protein L27